MTDGPVGVGLVGYGMSGSSLHGPLTTSEPRLALRAVVTLEPEQVRDLPGVPVLTSAAALLDDPAVARVAAKLQHQKGERHAVHAVAQQRDALPEPEPEEGGVPEGMGGRHTLTFTLSCSQ